MYEILDHIMTCALIVMASTMTVLAVVYIVKAFTHWNEEEAND